jgi:hypothetical protein
MPKRSRKVQKKAAPKSIRTAKSRPIEPDENQAAVAAVERLMELSDRTEGKNPMAVALGRRGGLKGGRARVDGMTKEELRRSAIKAARARWARRK